jgi:hypothetical protein
MRLLTLDDHKLPGFSRPITDFFSDNKRLESSLPTANLKNLWDFSAHSEYLWDASPKVSRPLPIRIFPDRADQRRQHMILPSSIDVQIRLGAAFTLKSQPLQQSHLRVLLCALSRSTTQ